MLNFQAFSIFQIWTAEFFLIHVMSMQFVKTQHQTYHLICQIITLANVLLDILGMGLCVLPLQIVLMYVATKWEKNS